MFRLEDLNTVELRKNFEENNVLKYIFIDNFISEDLALSLADEHNNLPEENWLDYSHTNQKKSGITDLSVMGEETRSLINKLQSPEFLKWLSEITGFKNLLSDPELDRAGLHRIDKGGFLNVHTDEQSHTKNRYWKRRLNLLLFLTPDFQQSWGGDLELWDKENKKIIESIVPKFNRCVLFATDNKSFHGHPNPLKCPAGTARRSIAIYYYEKVSKPLRVTPTTYMDLPGDSLKKRFAIKTNVLLLYLFATLKRYTYISDEKINKIRLLFK